MKRYLCRFCHHIDGLPDFTALRFTKYNQYESMILPLVRYLENHGVSVDYGMDVKNVIINDTNGKKVATQIVYEKNGSQQTIDLTETIWCLSPMAAAPIPLAMVIKILLLTLATSEMAYGESWDSVE